MPAWGAGGDALAAGGMEVMVHVRDLAVMGLGEVLRRLPFLRRARRALVDRVDRERPAMAILVDYPGMNLKLAETLRARGVRVVYYLCPKVWAWNRGRIPRMARAINRLLAIFPFEPDIFRGTGLRVDYVGNPLVEETRRARAAPAAAPVVPARPASVRTRTAARNWPRRSTSARCPCSKRSPKTHAPCSTRQGWVPR